MSTDVINLRRGQHRQGADVLVASHADYPAFRHVFPDARRRTRALRPFFAATLRDAIPFGSVHASVDADAMVAIAVWLPPGAFPWTSARQARAAPELVQTMIAAPRSFAAFARLGSNAARTHPTEPHWYLVALGVRPGHQGHGHGARLLTSGLQRADNDGTACYLTTSDPANVAYYQRFGFAVSDPALALVPGGPTHIGMHRPPKT